MWRSRPQMGAGGVLASPAASPVGSVARSVTDDLNGKAALGGAKPENSSFHYARHSWLSLVGSDPKMTGAALRVAIHLWSHMNAERGCAWPALTTIANDMGLDKSTVTRAIKLLSTRGWINVRRRGGRHRSNEYRIAFGSMLDDDSDLGDM